MMRYFTVAELAAAFALLLPQPEAEALAKRWFETFADSVDPQGYYIDLPWDIRFDDDWAEALRGGMIIDTVIEEGESIEDTPVWDAPAQVASDETLFNAFSEDSAEDYLMRFGDLHLALVALVNDDLYERMRLVRGMTESGAQRNRQQVRRGIDAYQRRMKAQKRLSSDNGQQSRS